MTARSPRSLFRRAGALALGTVLAVGAAACGDDEDGGNSGTTGAAVTTTVGAATTTIAGSATTGGGSATTLPPDVDLSGVKLRVTDQFELLQTPLRLSGEGEGTPYTLEYSNLQGAPAVFQAFAAGETDLSSVGDAGLFGPQASGQDFVVIAVTKTATYNQGLLVRPGSGVTSVADIAGKKIAYSLGTASQAYILRLLKSEGLTVDDVELVDLPSQAATAALQAGDVDVVASSNPGAPQYIAANPDASFIPTPGIVPGFTFYITTNEALEDPGKVAAIRDYLARLDRGWDWVNDHLADHVQAYYGDNLGLPADIVEVLKADAKPIGFIPLTDEVIAEQQYTTDLFVEGGALPNPLDVSKVFTDSFNDVFED